VISISENNRSEGEGEAFAIAAKADEFVGTVEFKKVHGNFSNM
jgi:hypothetical protein